MGFIGTWADGYNFKLVFDLILYTNVMFLQLFYTPSENDLQTESSITPLLPRTIIYFLYLSFGLAKKSKRESGKVKKKDKYLKMNCGVNWTCFSTATTQQRPVGISGYSSLWQQGWQQWPHLIGLKLFIVLNGLFGGIFGFAVPDFVAAVENLHGGIVFVAQLPAIISLGFP